MWRDLEKGFQAAFEEAWEAYKADTIPIGAAILNQNGIVMATGRNQIHSDGDGIIKYHQIAHAEINAILKLSEIKDQNIRNDIRTFTLYSTMEPCPLCFGAVVMGSIRNLKYAARDNYAGATALNASLDYIKNKKISVTGPFAETEKVQIAIQVCHDLQTGNNIDSLLASWKEVCENGVLIGEYLYNNHVLKDMAAQPFGNVYDYILSVELC
jgi:tRNA(adenine34) deaminase